MRIFLSWTHSKKRTGMTTFAEKLYDAQQTGLKFRFNRFPPNVRSGIVWCALFAYEFNVLRKNAQQIVLFICQSFTFCVHPPLTISTFHHFNVIIVIFVAFLTKWTVISLSSQSEAVAAHTEISNKFCDVLRCSAGFALQTGGADDWSISTEKSFTGS